MYDTFALQQANFLKPYNYTADIDRKSQNVFCSLSTDLHDGKQFLHYCWY